jgi:hypothetical protein
MNREQFDRELQLSPSVNLDVYESPIERSLLWSVHKHLRAPPREYMFSTQKGDVFLIPQPHIVTKWGLYRGDCVLHTPGLNTLIECDGEKFHIDSFRDDLRSAQILQSGLIDQIIRFNGRLLSYAPDDSAFFLRHVHPTAFEFHAERLLNMKATFQARQQISQISPRRFEINYTIPITSNGDYDYSDERYGERAELKVEFCSAKANEGPIFDLMQIIIEHQPNSTEQMEKIYWDSKKIPDDFIKKILGPSITEEEVTEMHDVSLRDRRDIFDEYWAVLRENFRHSEPRQSPQAYFEILSPRLSVPRFLLACFRAVRFEKFFPTPEKLLSYATKD